MPDRLFDDVLARVDRLPQRRVPPTLRFSEMNSRIRWLALAAAILVVAVAGLALINRPDGNVGTSPSPSPTSSSESGAALPAALIGRWMSGPRTLPGWNPDGTGSSLLFSENSVALTPSNQNNQTLLQAVASQAGGRLLLSADAAQCLVGDSGSYAWTLSPGGRILTISDPTDACAARAGAIPGVWWKMDCPTEDDPCLGDLEAGHYASQFIDPFVLATGSWRPRYAALEYTVPEGWANVDDWPAFFTIAPQDESRVIDIQLMVDPVPHAQGADQCTEKAEPGVERSAAAFGAWLASLPGLVPTTAEPTTVAGLSGFSVDLEVDASWTTTCPYSNGSPMVSTVTDLDAASGLDWNIGAGAKARYILLDLGEGRALLIKVESATKAAFEDNVEDAMSVIESFAFTR
jgi:hypothetical protein